MNKKSRPKQGYQIFIDKQVQQMKQDLIAGNLPNNQGGSRLMANAIKKRGWAALSSVDKGVYNEEAKRIENQQPIATDAKTYRIKLMTHLGKIQFTFSFF